MNTKYYDDFMSLQLSWKNILLSSWFIFKQNYVALITLGILSQTPKIIINYIFQWQDIGFSSYLSSRALDLWVFLAMPFFFQGKAISLKDITQKFFQNHFATLILLVLLHFAIFFPFFAIGFSFPVFWLGVLLLFFGMLFSSHFLALPIIYQKPRLISILQTSFLFFRKNIRNILVFLSLTFSLLAIPSIFWLLTLLESSIENSNNIRIEDLIALSSTTKTQLVLFTINCLTSPFESLFIGLLLIRALPGEWHKELKSFLYDEKNTDPI